MELIKEEKSVTLPSLETQIQQQAKVLKNLLPSQNKKDIVDEEDE